jgi:hypothetical protein
VVESRWKRGWRIEGEEGEKGKKVNRVLRWVEIVMKIWGS